MKKKILVVYYTQSGQMQEIVESFLTPFASESLQTEVFKISPKGDFPFPWTSDQFFDAMPESVAGIPMTLNPLEFNEPSYDLIVIAYQPWFLSPSIPVSSILQEERFVKLLKNTPVVTLIGARNMWLNAQEKMKKLLAASGAQLVGNIALVDRHENLTSAVTILHWMLTGKKEKKYGVFPLPGVSNADIAGASQFGAIVLHHLNQNTLSSLQDALTTAKAVEINSDLMFIEQRAGRLFLIWSRIINGTKNRKTWLVVFKYYLLVALFVVAPVVLLVNKILFRPFVGKSIKRKKEYYSGVK